jgi:hypothetical protein
MDQFALATEAASLRLALSEDFGGLSGFQYSFDGYTGAEEDGWASHGGAATAADAATAAVPTHHHAKPAAAAAKTKERGLRRWASKGCSRAAEAWQAWEGRGNFTYHAELAADLAINALSLGQYAYLWLINGGALSALSMLLLIDVRCALLALHRRLRAHMRYRAATHNVSFAFPDVPADKLSAQDADCAICRWAGWDDGAGGA